MLTIHRTVAVLLPAALLAVLVIAVVVRRVLRRDPTIVVQRATISVEVVLGVQVLAGLVLFATGARPGEWLHSVYGGAALVVLEAARRIARAMERDGWVVQGWGALIALLLAVRAFATGA